MIEKVNAYLNRIKDWHIASKKFSISYQTIIIISILAIGFILRAYGNNFGLPQIFSPDEPYIVDFAIKMAHVGDLNPHWFLYPSFLMYIDTIIIKIELFLDWLGLIYTDRASFYLSARFLSAVFGSLTLILVYCIGKVLYDIKVGIIATIFLAIIPLAVEDSHYATAYATLTFFLVLSFFFAALILRNGMLRYYMLAGISAGLAMSALYYGCFILSPIFIAHFLNSKKNINSYSSQSILTIILNKNLIFSLALFGFAFVMGTPYSLLDFRNFISAILKNSELVQQEGTNFLGTPPGWIYHLEYSLKDGMGFSLEILSILGIVFALLFVMLNRKRIRESTDIQSNILLLSMIFPYYIIIGAFAVKYPRYVIPLLPFLVLLGANLLAKSVDFVFDRTSYSYKNIAAYRNIILSILIIIIIISPIKTSINEIKDFAKEDTRQVALKWIEMNIPEQSTIIREMYTPETDLIKNIKSTFRWTLGDQNLNNFTGFDYIIVSSGMYDRYYAHPNEFAKETKLYNSLADHYELIKTFRPSKEILGPTIKIYKDRKNSTSITQGETVIVPADQPDPVYSNMTLKAGKTYLVRAAGVCSLWNNTTEGADAYYAYAKWRIKDTPQLWAILLINDRTMQDIARKNGDSIDYQSSHVYQTHIVGTGKRLKLQNYDAKKGSYKDNHGFINVTIIPASLNAE